MIDEASISVVVPVHAETVGFERCLSALAACLPPPLELIVVADGWAGAAEKTAERLGATLIRLPESLGAGAARNSGAAIARGEILLFIDSDVEAPAGLIGRVANAFRDEPELAAVIGSYDDEPDAPNFVSQYKHLFQHFIHQNARADACSFWGACGAIRREDFQTLGGFDEKYRYLQDVELGSRLLRSGMRIRLKKDLQVKHLKKWSAASLLRSDFMHRGLNWTRLILRERQLPNDLNLKRSSRVSAGLVLGSLACVALSPRLPFLLAVLAGFLAVILAVNIRLYRFFFVKRGLAFTLAAIPCHWFYYAYSSLAFALGIILHAARSPFERKDVAETGAQLPSDGPVPARGRNA